MAVAAINLCTQPSPPFKAPSASSNAKAKRWYSAGLGHLVLKVLCGGGRWWGGGGEVVGVVWGGVLHPRLELLTDAPTGWVGPTSRLGCRAAANSIATVSRPCCSHGRRRRSRRRLAAPLTRRDISTGHTKKQKRHTSTDACGGGGADAILMTTFSFFQFFDFFDFSCVFHFFYFFVFFLFFIFSFFPFFHLIHFFFFHFLHFFDFFLGGGFFCFFLSL